MSGPENLTDDSDPPLHALVHRAVAAVEAELHGQLTHDERALISRAVHARHRRLNPPTEPVPVLPRPDRTDPDAFARRVADAYRIALQHGGNPNRRLADAAGVPHTTVVGWVREARRRGALPPGQQGRATA